jgi:uncharacterized protein YndB with AHSA1/START domain
LKRDLHFDVTYPHPVEKVWLALTDPQAIAQWLMANDFEPRVGHRFQFREKPQPGWDGIVNCEVTAVDPPHRLSYSWRNGNLDTKVSWLLESVPEGTRVQLEHTGFRGVRGWMACRILGKGWGSRILNRNLPALLAGWTGEGPVPQIPEAQCRNR